MYSYCFVVVVVLYFLTGRVKFTAKVLALGGHESFPDRNTKRSIHHKSWCEAECSIKQITRHWPNAR